MLPRTRRALAPSCRSSFARRFRHRPRCGESHARRRRPTRPRTCRSTRRRDDHPVCRAAHHPVLATHSPRGAANPPTTLCSAPASIGRTFAVSRTVPCSRSNPSIEPPTCATSSLKSIEVERGSRQFPICLEVTREAVLHDIIRQRRSRRRFVPATVFHQRFQIVAHVLFVEARLFP